MGRSSQSCSGSLQPEDSEFGIDMDKSNCGENNAGERESTCGCEYEEATVDACCIRALGESYRWRGD